MPTLQAEEAAPNVWVVAPAGRVDANLAPDLEAELESLIHQGRSRLVVDFANASYMSSSGLKALLTARRKSREAGGEIALAGLSPEVLGVLEITGLDRLFRIFASRSEAAAALSA